ncbi:hypothetical protein [Halobacteriovorax sp. ZH2_bin.1]|uniref:hypothetical protein n=1 Tax=unclassified Halobacteriovorax TaxID=2639665 RepID=UPI00372293B9
MKNKVNTIFILGAFSLLVSCGSREEEDGSVSLYNNWSETRPQTTTEVYDGAKCSESVNEDLERYYNLSCDKEASVQKAQFCKMISWQIYHGLNSEICLSAEVDDARDYWLESYGRHNYKINQYKREYLGKTSEWIRSFSQLLPEDQEKLTFDEEGKVSGYNMDFFEKDLSVDISTSVEGYGQFRELCDSLTVSNAGRYAGFSTDFSIYVRRESDIDALKAFRDKYSHVKGIWANRYRDWDLKPKNITFPNFDILNLASKHFNIPNKHQSVKLVEGVEFDQTDGIYNYIGSIRLNTFGICLLTDNGRFGDDDIEMSQIFLAHFKIATEEIKNENEEE